MGKSTDNSVSPNEDLGNVRPDKDVSDRIRGILERKLEKDENGSYLIELWGYDVVIAKGIVDRFSRGGNLTKDDLLSRLNKLKGIGMEIVGVNKMKKEELWEYYSSLIEKINSEYALDSGPLPEGIFDPRSYSGSPFFFGE